MVTTNIKIDNLSAEITMAIKEYTEKASQAITKEVTATAKTVLEDIKKTSPVDTGEYKKGWARKKSRLSGQTEYTIYNKNKPSLAHLLEIGHAKVGGGRVRAIPHIRPAYDKHVPKMEKRIERILKRVGK